MITTIIFDFGGVLFTNGTKRFIASISSRYHIPQANVAEVIDGDLGSLYREAKITREDFWGKVIGTLHLTESADKLAKEWIEGYEIIEGTRRIIIELSKKYHLFYLSDNIKERVDALDDKFHFTPLFLGGIFSHEAGVRKPNVKIYELALRKAGSKPEETIYIDDKPPFLTPAQQLGMKTIVFTTPEQLQVDLDTLLT